MVRNQLWLSKIFFEQIQVFLVSINDKKGFIALAILLKHYRFVMHGLDNQLVCLPMLVEMTDSIKDTKLLQNLSIFRKLHICNAL
jgi:hypothetical protein